jgi:hypothetical protein
MGGRCRATALFKQFRASSVSQRSLTAHPTMERVHRSIKSAKYAQPSSDVATPRFMRSGFGEVAVEEIGSWRVSRIGFRRVPKALCALRPQAKCFHASSEPLAAYTTTLAMQGTMNSWTAVPLFAACVSRSDLGIESRRVLRPTTRLPAAALVDAAARQFQRTADRSDRRLGLRSQEVHVSRHDVPSFAKKAVARLRISRSCFSGAFELIQFRRLRRSTALRRLRCIVGAIMDQRNCASRDWRGQARPLR